MTATDDSEERCEAATAEWDVLCGNLHLQVDEGVSWVERNIDLPVAGRALNLLFLYRPSPPVMDLAEKWLQQYMDHSDSPAVVGRLLVQRPNEFLLEAAAKFIEDGFAPSCPYMKKLAIATTISAIASDFAHTKLAQSIAEQLENDFRNEIWEHVFPVSTYDKPNVFAENLTARWISLNVESDLRFLPITPIATLTPSSDVVRACFNWMQCGGRHNKDLAYLLTDVLEESQRCPEVRLELATFARCWLQENPTDDESGRVFGALVNATNLEIDFENSLLWYECHKENHSASYLVADLLKYHHRNAKAPSRFLIAEAKRILKEECDFPVLAARLLQVYADEETVNYLKGAYKADKLDWIGVELLRYAKDDEIVECVLEREAQWGRSKNAPGFICALLFASPEDKRVLDVASRWIKDNPDHTLAKMVQDALVGKFDW